MSEGARAAVQSEMAMAGHEAPLAHAFATLREARTLATREPGGPTDAVYRVLGCLKCSALSVDAADPGGTWASWLAWPRVESVGEAADLIEVLTGDVPVGTDPCACDPRRGAHREVIGARWYRTVAGTGLEVCVEGHRAPRAAAGASPWSWRVLVAPTDGAERVVSETLDPRALNAAMGRPLAVIDVWRELLRLADAGESAMAQVEPGLWLFAGPDADARWRAAIAEVRTGGAGRTVLTADAMVLAHAPWARREELPLEGLVSARLHAGVIVEGPTLASLVRIGLLRAGAAIDAEGTTDDRIVAKVGDLRCGIEIPTVAEQGLAQMWTLAETAAVTVGEVVSRLHRAMGFLGAIAARRPHMRFGIDGFTAWPVHADQSIGRPFGLLREATAAVLDAEGLEREARYACDPLPAYADALRVCPCGAGAWLTQRLIPWGSLEAITRAANGEAPATTAVFRDADVPLAALAVAICCDRHVRLLTRAELLELGLTGPALTERLAADRAHEVFGFGTLTRTDEGGHTAVLAHGSMLASALFDDGLLAGLHGALGAPLPSDREVHVVSNAPGVLVLYEDETVATVVDDLLSEGALRDGAALGTMAPFRLARVVRLSAAPKGRFVPS